MSESDSLSPQMSRSRFEGIIASVLEGRARPKLIAPLFAVEADWVVDRLYSYSPGQYTLGGALYSRYQASPQVAFAARAEYLNDRGGLYSGLSQVIREGTLTTEYRFVDGFLARAEFRRDATGQPYFLSDALGVLRGHQDTYTLGLVWWLGGKEGVW